MRGLRTVAVIGLVVAACAQPGTGDTLGRAAPAEPAPSVCRDFIDATAALTEETDIEAYTLIMNKAAVPVFEYLVHGDRHLPPGVGEAWENLAFGTPTSTDLEAVHYVGGVLVPELGALCEEIGQNVFAPPPSPLHDLTDVPEVTVTPLYEDGTIDHACDVFIQTLDGWSDERSTGAEIGLHIADLTDQLIGGLESQGVTAGISDLAAYADKYRTAPIVQANEAAEAFLAAASQALAVDSVVCGHLNTWNHRDIEPTADLAYHRFRWSELGFADYTMEIGISDAGNPRGRQELVVVVSGGRAIELYDIRTAQRVEPPYGVPITINEMFETLKNEGAADTFFHPVLGYPEGIGAMHVVALDEGTEFDRSILGSTADAVAIVKTIERFTPGKACGSARVPGGEPIPDTRPLDADARQALAALTAVEEEGAPFTSTYDYGIFERTTDVLVVLGHDGSGNYSSAVFDREGDAWKPVSWGTCHWVDDGFGMSPWALDPETPFDPASGEIHLITADRCGSHTAHGNEYVVVEAAMENSVELVVWRADHPPPPPEGPEAIEMSCAIGTVVKLTVILRDPIGSRALVGATEPADWPEDF
ncbi:MAG: DUF6174 domain-containing protein [Acidimicrobiia bacterium]